MDNLTDKEKELISKLFPTTKPKKFYCSYMIYGLNLFTIQGLERKGYSIHESMQPVK